MNLYRQGDVLLKQMARLPAATNGRSRQQLPFTASRRMAGEGRLRPHAVHARTVGSSLHCVV